MKLIKVTDAAWVEGYRIHLSFDDGLSCIVNLETYLWGEMFEPLQDPETFRKFSLNPWTIEWDNGADFAPEFLHDLAKKQLSTLPARG